MKNTFLIGMVTFGLTFSAIAKQPDVPLPKDTVFFRQPTLLVPKSDTAFKADGELTDEELTASAELEQFITFEEHARGDNRVTAYLAHNGRQLYVAFKVRRATSKPIVANETQRDSRLLWGKDDTVELRIFPTKNGYDFVGNSNSVAGDATFTRHSDQTWNSDKFTYASKQVEGGWQGEYVFDAATFDLEQYKPGDVWMIDIFNAARSDGMLSGWAYLAGLWRYEFDRFPRIVFGGDDSPYQTKQQLGKLADDRAGLDAAIANPGQSARDVKVWAGFYRHKGESPPQPYYTELKGVLDPQGIEILPGATYEQLVEFAAKGILANYTQAQLIDQTMTVKPGETLPLQLRKPDLPGQYIAAWRYEDAQTGQLISAGVYPFSIHPPIKLDFEYHYLVGKRVYIKSLISDELANEIDRMLFEVSRDGKTVAEASLTKIEGNVTMSAPVSTDGWPAGEYAVTAKAMSGDKVVSQTAMAMVKPEPPFWWQSDAGKLIKLPKPWTPVVADAQTTDVWGRNMVWNRGLLPQQIISQGQTLFTKPARVKAVIEGKQFDLSYQRFELASSDEAAAVYAGYVRAAGLQIETMTTVEFDGMTRFDWEFRGNTQIDKLFLEFPIDNDVAELVATYLDKVEKSGRVPTEPTAYRFTPSIVVRNGYVGLEWFAECEQHWSNADDEKLIELIPHDDHMLLRIRIIDKPKRVTEPFTITFGIIAWPVKPWPKDRVFYTNYLGTPPDKRKDKDWDYWDDGMAEVKKYHVDMVEWFHWNANGSIPDYPVYYTDEIRKRVTDFANLGKKHGMPVIGHTGYALPTDTEDFPFYGMEMVARPLVSKGRYGYVYTHTPAYIDAYVTRYKKIAQETGFSGLQSDGGLNVRYGENLEAGFGWYDENGKLRGRYPIFACRELTRRLYNVFHGEVDFPWLPDGNGHITLHTYYPMGACHGFLDSIHTGESRRSWGSFHTLKIDTERAVYPSRSFGIPLHCLSKLKKATHGGRGRLAFSLLYGMWPAGNRVLDHLDEENYKKHSFPAHRVYDALEWVDTQPDRYFGYWENEHLVQFAQKDFYAAVHLQKGKKMVLAVINWLPDKRRTDVTVNLEKLGFENGAIKVVDAITDETIPINVGTMQLDVEGDAYRLLKIWKP